MAKSGKKWIEGRNAAVQPRQSDYDPESDIHTMTRAEEIKNNPARMKAMKACVKKKMAEMKKIMPEE